jgi:serine/threonine protein kinase
LKKLKPGQLLVRAPDKVRPASAVPGTWQPPTPEELGELLPQYRIECLIGRGGMGAVYKGIQPELARPVAIKVLPTELAADEEFVTRFKREARMLAQLQHSRIITIHDFGHTSDGRLYLVMEHIGGGDLRSLLRGPGLTLDQALLAISQICDALCAAHRQGVVHLDIKPENILITQDGYIKLVDFGLARPLGADPDALTNAAIVAGTPAYMAPEQREGSGDHRSDIYALGVMLYEMLTGKRPQGVFDPPSVKAKIDPRLDQVVMKALQQEPDRRYQDASELKRDVESIRATLRATAGAAKRPSGKTRPWKRDLIQIAQFLRKHAVASGVVLGVALVALAGALAWGKRQHRGTTEQPDQTMAGEPAEDSPSALPSANTTPAPEIGNAAIGALKDQPSVANSQPLPVAESAANETSTPSPKPIQKAEPIVAPPSPVSPVATSKSPPFVNSLGMTFVPGGTRGVLFCAWDTRVQDFREFEREPIRGSTTWS